MKEYYGSVTQYLHAHYPMKEVQLRFEFVMVFSLFFIHLKIMVDVEIIYNVTQIYKKLYIKNATKNIQVRWIN